MNTVTLSPSELTTAANIGSRRQVQNLVKGRQDAHGCPVDDGWTPHVEGACGEMALAKFLGIYWSGNLGDLKADDVGQLQVRTRSRHDYELILHKSDPDDRAFVLITGLAPNFRIHGWIMARYGKVDAYWGEKGQKGRPAYFVPHSALRPMDTLNVARVLH